MDKNLLTRAQDRFYFGYPTWAIPNEIWPSDELTATINTAPEWTRAYANHAFTAGARWGLRMSSELSPHIARFIEMMLLLGYLEPTDLTEDLSSRAIGVLIDNEADMDD